MDIVCTEEDLENFAIAVSVWAKERGLKNVYGVPEGGKPMAERIAEILEIPIVENAAGVTGTTLVVDDVVDSGSTILNLSMANQWPPLSVAAVFYCQNPFIKPNFFWRTKKSEDWVIFPRENPSAPKRKNNPAKIRIN